MALQGPHQAAQKSTSTGCSLRSTSSSKFASFTSKTPNPAMLLLANYATDYWLWHRNAALMGCGGDAKSRKARLPDTFPVKHRLHPRRSEPARLIFGSLPCIPHLVKLE